MHAEVPCGEFIPDKDLFGGDLPNSLRVNTTRESCLDWCRRTAQCDAFTWLPFGQAGDCYLKDYIGQQATNRTGGFTYLLCLDEKEDLEPSSTESGATPEMQPHRVTVGCSVLLVRLFLYVLRQKP